MLVEHGTLYTRAVELQGDMTYSPVSSGIFFPDGYDGCEDDFGEIIVLVRK